MASAKVVVNKADGTSYDVRIGEGLIDQVGSDVNDRFGPSKAFLLYDASVSAGDRDRVKSSVRQQGIDVAACKVPKGSGGRTLACVSEIWQAMAQAGIGRDGAVVAFGDAQTIMVGELVAKLYMGGVRVVVIPMLLNVACTHCLGGFASASQGASYIGHYAFPDFACIDVALFDQMTPMQWTDGFAQIAEMAVLGSDDFFFYLSDNADDLANHKHIAVITALAHATSLLADARADDVSHAFADRSHPISLDEAQMSLLTSDDVSRSQRMLRYGDELASALVDLHQAQSWGLAHAEGMRFSMRVAAATLGTSLDLVKSQDDLLSSLGLGSTAEDGLSAVTTSEALHALERGSYGRRAGVQFVLPLDVGKSTVSVVPTAALKQHLEAWVASHQ